MSILFSDVHLKSEHGEKDFLVCGIPTREEDLIRYTAYQDYLSELNGETEIDVHTDAYLYGEGECVNATIEEVAYMMMRKNKNPDFLDRHCRKAFDADFTIRIDDGQGASSANRSSLVGRIDFLYGDGKVGESLEFTDPIAFVAKVKKENYYGVPMHLTLFRNNFGTTIDTSFLLELDPPNVTVDYADEPFERLDCFDMKI